MSFSKGQSVPPGGSRRGPQEDLDCDVCVVGATLAGLWAAVSLALRGRSVVLLDAGGIEPYRGSGLVRPGLGLSAVRLCARSDRASVRRLYDLSAGAARSATRLLDVLGMEARATGLLQLPGPLGKPDVLEEAAARDVLGLHELVRLSPADMSDALGIESFAGGLYDAEPSTYDAEDLPLVLTSAARAAGVRIFEHAPLVDTDLDGVRKYLHTATHRVRAEHVVFSTDRGLGTAAPWIARALGEACFVSGSFSLGGGRAMPSETVVEGGARGVRFAWDGTTLAFTAPTASLVRGEVAAACALRRHAARFYPKLRHAVAGHARGFRVRTSRHGLPLIGAFRPGVWYGIALGAEPLANASLAADLIGDAIIERDDRIEAFAPFGPSFAWGFAGRLAGRAAYWAGRLMDSSDRSTAEREARAEAILPAEPAGRTAET
ncbi:FAD-binding oxidoreductase [Aquabacter sp. CN5-332]|uniref:NAD(P)/FAD-dependent oxidoreductase n=1 Tax=Aquabacter sp. CN5-332 TaxID=3156608 RepID=UPI0032B45147